MRLFNVYHNPPDFAGAQIWYVIQSDTINTDNVMVIQEKYIRNIEIGNVFFFCFLATRRLYNIEITRVHKRFNTDPIYNVR